MQVFIVDSPYITAGALDKKRLNKQIIECRQILAAINGETKAWANHPVTKMYSQHVPWLALYMQCLQAVKNGWLYRAMQYSDEADNIRPSFQTDLYFRHMKRRLYTKDPVFYFAYKNQGGKTEINMYWDVPGAKWIYYRNGKRLKLTKYPLRLIDNLISALTGTSEDYKEGQDIAKQLKATGDPYLIERVDKILEVL